MADPPNNPGGGGENTGGGAGGGGTPPPAGTPPPGGVPPGGGSGGGVPELTPEVRAYLQSEIDRVAGSVRAEEKTKAERARQKDEDDKKAALAKEQGKFQELYETEQRKAATLQAQVDQAVALATEMNSSIDAEVKDWDSDLKTSDPGKDNIQARMAWVKGMRGAAAKLKAASAPPQHTGHGAPPPAGGAGTGGVKPSEAADKFLQSRYTVPGVKTG